MSERNDVQTAMSDASDAEKSLDRMKIFMELRGLQPNTVYTFALCARRLLAHAGKAPADIKAADVESFLLDLTRKGRSPQTRNVNLSAVRCLLFATLGDDSRVNSSSYQGDWLKHYALTVGEPVNREMRAPGDGRGPATAEGDQCDPHGQPRATAFSTLPMVATLVPRSTVRSTISPAPIVRGGASSTMDIRSKLGLHRPRPLSDPRSRQA